MVIKCSRWLKMVLDEQGRNCFIDQCYDKDDSLIKDQAELYSMLQLQVQEKPWYIILGLTFQQSALILKSRSVHKKAKQNFVFK